MSSYSQLKFCAMSASVSQYLDGRLSVWLSNWIFCCHQVELDLELVATVSPLIQLLDCQFLPPTSLSSAYSKHHLHPHTLNEPVYHSDTPSWKGQLIFFWFVQQDGAIPSPYSFSTSTFTSAAVIPLDFISSNVYSEVTLLWASLMCFLNFALSARASYILSWDLHLRLDFVVSLDGLVCGDDVIEDTSNAGWVVDTTVGAFCWSYFLQHVA